MEMSCAVIVMFLAILAGTIISLIGWVKLLILMFQEHIVWGLAGLFFPVVIIVYAVMNWEICKEPFLMYMGGIALAVIVPLIALLTGLVAMPEPTGVPTPAGMFLTF
ncbi:MAG: hypothetical protein ACLFQV_00730 [Vulcanimicrobiota bacterium]